MNRKEFILNCGYACIGSTFMGSMLQSCSSSKMITSDIVGDELIVPIKHFKSNSSTDPNYLIVRNEKLQFPICVYQLANNHYSALLMRCTHKGNELQVFGNKLQCPAHGSEFENTGKVSHGPAEKNLRTLPVTIESTNIRISLK